jgi:hypothetical protein
MNCTQNMIFWFWNHFIVVLLEMYHFSTHLHLHQSIHSSLHPTIMGITYHHHTCLTLLQHIFGCCCDNIGFSSCISGVVFGRHMFCVVDLNHFWMQYIWCCFKKFGFCYCKGENIAPAPSLFLLSNLQF